MKCHQWSQCSIGPIRSSEASMYKRISHWSVNVTERTRWLLKRRGSKSSSQGQWLDSSDRCGLVKVTLSWNKVSHAKVQCLQTRDLVAFFSIRRLLGICTTVKRCPAWEATGKGLDLAARCDALEESVAQGLFLTTWYFGRSKHLCLYEFHVICAIWIYFRKVHQRLRGSVWRNSENHLARWKTLEKHLSSETNTLKPKCSWTTMASHEKSFKPQKKTSHHIWFRPKLLRPLWPTGDDCILRCILLSRRRFFAVKSPARLKVGLVNRVSCQWERFPLSKSYWVDCDGWTLVMVHTSMSQ